MPGERRSRWGAFARGPDEVDRQVRDRTYPLERRVRELEREVADLVRILAGLGEGVIAIDRAGIVRHANPAAIEMLEMEPGGSIGSHMFVAVPHQGVCLALDFAMRGGAHSGPSQREISGMPPRADRSYVLLTRSLRGPGIDDADAEGAIAVLRDVTDIRRLERARHDFFANVSHELKTPITAIRGAIETIQDDPRMDRDVRDRFLAGASKHATRLGMLVTDLMSLARLEAGAEALQLERVDLGALAAEVVASAEHLASRADVAVLLDPAGGDARDASVVVEGDEEALRQAISNLIVNAIAYSERGSAVFVRVQEDPAGSALIEVADTGPGIPLAARERIFERFFRVDEARSRERGGTGIGLSIVKHVAQSHHGTVEVESDVGVGSTFRLTIPVSGNARSGTSST